MAFLMSPGVHVTEKDLTNIVPAVSTSIGGFAGPFAWGPVMDVTTVSSEKDLLERFGKPKTENAASWFTAANFLNYANNLLIVRANTVGLRNAVAKKTGSVGGIVINPGGSGTGYNPLTDEVYIHPPVNTWGTQATATFSINTANGAVTGFNITNPGSGYDVAPVVEIIRYPNLSGRGFDGYTQLGTGSVHSINVTTGGVGYDPTLDTVVISAPTGPEPRVQATATFTVANGAVTSFEIINPGSGYTETPSVTIQPGEDRELIAYGFTGNTVLSRSIANAVVTRGGFEYNVTNYDVSISSPNLPGGVQATAEFTVSSDGNGIVTGIQIINPGRGYTTPPTIKLIRVPIVGGLGLDADVFLVNAGVKIKNEYDYQSIIKIGNELDYDLATTIGGGILGQFIAKYPGSLGNSIEVSIVDAITYDAFDPITNQPLFKYRGEFNGAPGTSPWVKDRGGSNDELHVIVVDKDGLWTGNPGTILERYAYVSKASDAKSLDGANNYYRDVINRSSKYIWWAGFPDNLTNDGSDWGESSIGGTVYKTLTGIEYINLSGGTDDYLADDGDLMLSYDMFLDTENVDVNLLMAGPAGPIVSKYIIQNICEVRKDCVGFVSPIDIRTGSIIQGHDATEKLIQYRNDVSFNVNSSYGVIDSGYKYQLDKYNDTYRWVPLNGDVAGLCARTDNTNDPWWSPGGLNRGQIKNVIKLAFNPNQTDRDNMYKKGINPVVSFPGQGTVLWGDKTLLDKASAFDRINVRRLFIVLEKAIATAAKYYVFEFNDRFTRAQFKSMVEPYLRNVQGRRGIYDFRVVCDESNNTGEVIDRNEFVADIYIKPARSINFIYLNFIAVRTAVSFEEVVGY